VREKQEAKSRRKEGNKAVKEVREKFSSSRSELISYCKLLSAYFSFVNDQTNRLRVLKQISAKDTSATDEGSADWKITEELIGEFCREQFLMEKQVKEVHYLCIQLEKMMKEDIIIGESTDLET
jgi:hypothetical protein